MSNLEIFHQVKLLVCDFDGVFTDNRVIVDENGKESVVCSRADSLGVEMLKKIGIEVIVISKERNAVVNTRCKKMKIPSYSDVDKKLGKLKEEITKRGLTPREVCYIGNDINDLECIQHVVGVAVNDAVAQVKKAAKLVTKERGGKGAVRELADILLKATKL